MELKKTSQISIDEIKDTNFDLFIVASGFESRARFFAENNQINAQKKICLSFLESSENVARKENDLKFKSLGFDFFTCSGNSNTEIVRILNDVISTSKEHLNVLVDYSSMTRVWYAAIINCLKNLERPGLIVSLWFVYSSSKYTEPPKSISYNKYVGPINGFYSITIPDRPSALIIGLGYVEARAFGLAEFFDVQPLLFIADNSSSKEFCEEVQKNNSTLLSTTTDDNIFYYPLNNMNFTENLLFRICKDLQEKYRLILAPCGPKPFTLLCLLTSLRFQAVDVWRISAGEMEETVDKQASGLILCYSATFAN